jgi:cytochrome c5
MNGELLAHLKEAEVFSHHVLNCPNELTIQQLQRERTAGAKMLRDLSRLLTEQEAQRSRDNTPEEVAQAQQFAWSNPREGMKLRTENEVYSKVEMACPAKQATDVKRKDNFDEWHKRMRGMSFNDTYAGTSPIDGVWAKTRMLTYYIEYLHDLPTSNI